MREKRALAVALLSGLLIVAGVAVFAAIRWWTWDIREHDVDPQHWQARFPRHYDATMRTRLDYGRTAYGGSTRYDRLEANPFRRRAFAGHPFALEYHSARGHYYAQIDQRESLRTRQSEQPAACVHCHAAEAPALVAEFGWEQFHHHSYDELKDRLHHGTSCADCHAPEDMTLRVTREAFLRAMQRRGVDVTQASREQLRTFVCAQCHVEYYFRGPDQQLVLPWDHGWEIDQIERHFDDYAFHDWIHAETKAPMIKIQHPEFELYSTGTHARRGVACVDCHMPQVRQRGLTLTDHWIRSPLTNVQNSCGSCHAGPPERLLARSEEIQHRTSEQLQRAEAALNDLIEAIVAAQDAGVDDAALAEARRLHRRAQMRWDFIDAENSTGFHSPHETADVLMRALDLARQGERSARAAARSARE